MPSDNIYTGVKHVVHISTYIETFCEHCQTSIGGLDHFAESINHYIEQHGYRLLHIGTETTDDLRGNLWQSTAATLGK